MAWQQLTLTVTQEQVDVISIALTELGALTVTIEDALDEPLFELPPESVVFWSHCRITGLFEADVSLGPMVSHLEHLLQSSIEAVITELPDQDWERACLEHFKPMLFGERLWICPSWDSVSQNDAVIIKLDPGLAFGTGTHPTTRLMLEWLDSADIQNKTVIDYGCGSGILAIAAAKLGASQVIAVDHDPQALTATLNNAKENNVGEKIKVCLPDAVPSIQADMVLANIILKPLMILMPTFVSHMKKNSQLILSGLLSNQAKTLLDVVPDSLHFVQSQTLDDWMRLELSNTA